MRLIARELQMSDPMIRKIITEDISYRSYILRRGQSMTQLAKEMRLEIARKLVTNVKIWKMKNPLILCSDIKNSQQDQIQQYKKQHEAVWKC